MGREIKVLFCGTGMTDYGPEKSGYLGIHITNHGTWQRGVVKLLVESINGLEQELRKKVRVIFKPHWNSGTYAPFLKTLKPKFKFNLLMTDSAIEDYYHKVDLLIFSYVGTAMIGTGMTRKPSVFIDIGDPRADSELVKASCAVVKTKEDIQAVLRFWIYGPYGNANA